MTITVPWLWVEVARALAACIAAGAAIGVMVSLAKITKESHHARALPRS